MKAYDHKDKLMFQAHREGYRARSVYKLKQLDEEFELFQSGMRVLDLAAAPGSWLQYAAQKTGPTGKVVGIDLKEIAPIPNVHTQVADINDSEKMKHILSNDRFDIVLSDIAPNTTGIPGVDHAKSVELNRQILQIARKALDYNGNLVMKVFDGPEVGPFLREIRESFRYTRVTKVDASRERSKEVYIICFRKI